MTNSNGKKPFLRAILALLMVANGCSAMMDVDDSGSPKDNHCEFWSPVVKGELQGAMCEKVRDAASGKPCERTLVRIRGLKKGLTSALNDLERLRADTHRFKDAGRCQESDFVALQWLNDSPTLDSYANALGYEPSNQATAERFVFALSNARQDLAQGVNYFEDCLIDAMEKHYITNQPGEFCGDDMQSPPNDEQAIALLAGALREQRMDADSGRISRALQQRIEALILQIRSCLSARDAYFNRAAEDGELFSQYGISMRAADFEEKLSFRPKNYAAAVRFEAALATVYDDLQSRFESMRVQLWEKEEAEWGAFFADWPTESEKRRMVSQEGGPVCADVLDPKDLNREAYASRAAR